MSPVELAFTEQPDYKLLEYRQGNEVNRTIRLLYFSWTVLYMFGQVSVDGWDWLRAGRSGNRVPVRRNFRTHPDLHWGPPSLLYNGYPIIPWG